MNEAFVVVREDGEYLILEEWGSSVSFTPYLSLASLFGTIQGAEARKKENCKLKKVVLVDIDEKA